MRLCDPSQNGLFFESPQAHIHTGSSVPSAISYGAFLSSLTSRAMIFLAISLLRRGAGCPALSMPAIKDQRRRIVKCARARGSLPSGSTYRVMHRFGCLRRFDWAAGVGAEHEHRDSGHCYRDPYDLAQAGTFAEKHHRE